MPNAVSSVPTSILDTIGKTPILRLAHVVPPRSAEVLVKLEFFNPTGSYKDRMAWAMIEGAEARGDLRPGMTVVEYTGGSTGSSLALVCAVKGYRLRIVSSDAFAREKLDTMRAFGAEVELMPSVGGKVTPDLLPRMVERARQLAAEQDTYWTDQLRNADSVVGYQSIGEEIAVQVDGPVHAFCGAVGTGGLLTGVARALRTAGHTPRIVALEPAGSPILSSGRGGSHHVEGTGLGFVPPLLAAAGYDQALAIDEDEARQMVRRLTREEGIFAGTSSGLNVLGALHLARELGTGHTVVTVAVDTGLKYLNGDLYRD